MLSCDIPVFNVKIELGFAFNIANKNMQNKVIYPICISILITYIDTMTYFYLFIGDIPEGEKARGLGKEELLIIFLYCTNE